MVAIAGAVLYQIVGDYLSQVRLLLFFLIIFVTAPCVITKSLPFVTV